MIRFEIDEGNRFEVEHGNVICLDEPEDMALIVAAVGDDTFGLDPAGPDQALVDRVLAFYGRGRVIDSDGGDDTDDHVEGRVY